MMTAESTIPAQEGSSTSNFSWKSEYDLILLNIADTDQVNTEWSLLKDIIKTKLRQNIISNVHGDQPTGEGSSGERHEDYENRIIEYLENFEGPPFTIQRLCELLMRPTEHHKTLFKYLRAIEKVVAVTSSFEEFTTYTMNGEANKFQSSESSLATESMDMCIEPSLSPIPFYRGKQDPEEQETNGSGNHNAEDNQFMTLAEVETDPILNHEDSEQENRTDSKYSENQSQSSGDDKSEVKPDEKMTTAYSDMDTS
ncbi:uncharacterized protein VTP21DRAFT_8395 [Calcarisporiella thermophila]|uniref:uncharacterized protein n=1 Tax=Calcarisporiella thermophila TaxID=911321 RepID=UPI00374343CC